MDRPTSIDDWLRVLSDEEMPVFAQTARRVAGISASADTSVAELTRVVLMDSAMTTRVLRLANSVYYNPADKRITTVSRAIVMLGFETIRTIALSIAMVDTMMHDSRHERAVEEMARAFHAAVQAKALAIKRGEAAVEEVFIAALLLRLGAVAFWCFPHGYADALAAALGDHDHAHERPEQAEREILGFTFAELTAALNREWRLSELLGRVLDGAHARQGRVQAIELGCQIATCASEFGWSAPQTNQCISHAATLINAREDDTRQHVHANARETMRAAIEYGADLAAQRIPLPPLASQGIHVAQTIADLPSDPDFQLRILRELSAMLSERVDINALLGMVLEGIYRGVSVDRAVLALTNADGTRLAAKFVLGGDERLTKSFNFAVSDKDNLIVQLLNGLQPAWINRSSPRWRQAHTPDLLKCLGETEFFVFPLGIGGRPRGLFYADRKTTQRPLDERSYDTFRHFCEQAVIGLSVIGLRGG